MKALVTICYGSVSKFSEDFESDNNDGDEPRTKDIKNVYHVIYNNWLNVCKLDKSLKEKIMKLTKEKKVMKRVAINYEFLATEKERKV